MFFFFFLVMVFLWIVNFYNFVIIFKNVAKIEKFMYNTTLRTFDN